MKRRPRIQETQKTVEIKNYLDEIKYIVSLEKSVKDLPSMETVYVYTVRVYNDVDEDPIYVSDDYILLRDALREFDRNVANYTSVVTLQYNPVDDIESYAKKIKYEKINPDCCFNCVFCKRDMDRRRLQYYKGSTRSDLICTNPDNFVLFENLGNPGVGGCPPRRPDGVFRPHMCDYGYGLLSEYASFQPYPMPKPPFFGGKHVFDPHPRVDFNGICKNYQRRDVSVPLECIAYGMKVKAEDVVGLESFIDQTVTGDLSIGVDQVSGLDEHLSDFIEANVSTMVSVGASDVVGLDNYLSNYIEENISTITDVDAEHVRGLKEYVDGRIDLIDNISDDLMHINGGDVNRDWEYPFPDGGYATDGDEG